MTSNTDKELIAELQEVVKEQAEFIKKIMDQPTPYGVIAWVQPENEVSKEPDEDGNLPYRKIVIATGNGGLIEANYPEFDVEAGDTVCVVQQTGQISRSGLVPLQGEAVEIEKVLSDTSVEIQRNNASVAIFKSPGMKLRKGDRVRVDPTGTVVVAKLESAAKQYMRPATQVTWDDIGGLSSVKEMLKEIVELPHTRPDIFQYYNYSPPKGVLLSGPPGCGKTMLGKATATAVASVGDGVPGFIYVKGPEILNKYVGESEARIRQIFDQARQHKEAHGSPAIIFIDEAESVLSRRGTGVSSDMEKTIVPAFLAEMDGLDETAAVVILATNRPDQLDPAVVRDGRIDRKIRVTRPDVNAAIDIARLNLAKVPTKVDGGYKTLAKVLVDEIFNPERQVILVRTREEGDVPMHLSDLISGSMVANIAQRAVSFALQRDLANGKKSGLTREDVVRAVDLITNEMSGISHDDEIREFSETKGLHVVGFSKRKEPIAVAA